MAEAPVTLERLREVLDYDHETGVFRWKLYRGKAKAGKVAGTVTGSKRCRYIQIQIDGVIYKAHRLAWFYVNGHWPEKELDHENTTGTDNRIANLREVTHLMNQQNLRAAHADSEVGLLGVVRNGSGFSARIMAEGKKHHLGTFRTPEAAHAVYVKAKRELHEGCTL